ncbi:hypothetical protein TYRP_007429 [Tyrophagus putrescentiae]|nr:hypothetical protein TYRP_007429 [Tyrophagus putrescentiae]
MAFLLMHCSQDLRLLLSVVDAQSLHCALGQEDFAVSPDEPLWVSPDNWLNVGKVRWVPELFACYRQRHFGWPMSSHLTLAVCHCQTGGGRL